MRNVEILTSVDRGEPLGRQSGSAEAGVRNRGVLSGRGEPGRVVGVSDFRNADVSRLMVMTLMAHPFSEQTLDATIRETVTELDSESCTRSTWSLCEHRKGTS